MNEEHLQTLERILRAFRLIDESHDRNLITDNEFNASINQLTSKAQAAITLLLT